MASEFEYVRFRLGRKDTREERFAALGKVLGALRERKAREASGQLDEDSANTEAREMVRLVHSPAAIADLETDLSLILACEYFIGDLVRLGSDLAEVRYDAQAWPYGGVTSLVRLVESFGFEIEQVDNGTDVLSAEDFRER